MKTPRILMLIIILLALIACSDEQPQPTPDDGGENQDFKSKVELVSGKWRIDSAFHAGSYDVSSSGKSIEFFTAGTYNFNGTLNGHWYFTQDSTQMVLDEGTTYRQDWKLTELEERRFVADFKSPFTGMSSQWIMKKGL